MKWFTFIILVVYVLALPQALYMTMIHRKEPEKYGMNLKYKLPWLLHFLSIWIIMPWFMVKYHIIDRK